MRHYINAAELQLHRHIPLKNQSAISKGGEIYLLRSFSKSTF